MNILNLNSEFNDQNSDFESWILRMKVWTHTLNIESMESGKNGNSKKYLDIWD